MRGKDDHTYVISNKKQTFLNILFSGSGFTAVMILIEFFIIYSVYRYLLPYVWQFISLVLLADIIATITIASSNTNPDFKKTWITIVFLMPGLGFLIYFLIQFDPFNHRFMKYFVDIQNGSKGYIQTPRKLEEQIRKEDSELYKLHRYLEKTGNDGIYTNCRVTYFASGEEQFPVMIEKLKQARKFIFLEYFVIETGKLWGEILEVLLQKVSEGVDVRIIYDGTCDFKHLPHNYYRQLNKLGIKTIKFAPIYPFISQNYNFRDHRKTCVIDGQIAFNGGTNLADEYANIDSPFGYWKDSAVMVEGAAVQAYTLMFLQIFSAGKDAIEYQFVDEKTETYEDNGYVIPYADIPVDEYHVGQQVYMDLINDATRSIYIMTPYFACDYMVVSALRKAALSGIDVNIIFPGIPDKYLTNCFAKEKYASLINAGVNVYQFTNGFIHSKQIVVDSQKAVVGSINFDFRSFNYSFENATYMYNCSCIKDIEKDMKQTIRRSEKIEYPSLKRFRKQRLLARLFKIFEPMF